MPKPSETPAHAREVLRYCLPGSSSCPARSGPACHQSQQRQLLPPQLQAAPAAVCCVVSMSLASSKLLRDCWSPFPSSSSLMTTQRLLTQAVEQSGQELALPAGRHHRNKSDQDSWISTSSGFAIERRGIHARGQPGHSSTPMPHSAPVVRHLPDSLQWPQWSAWPCTQHVFPVLQGCRTHPHMQGVQEHRRYVDVPVPLQPFPAGTS